MAQAAPERRPVSFNRFAGLRLDLALDEIGAESASYLRDVDWDGNAGKLRPRDGFQKLKAAEATGPYKGLFPHSPLRLLATKRVSSESLKLVAIDKEGVEQKETSLNKAEAKPAFAHWGNPTSSYTYMRTNVSAQKVVRFDGTNFTEPKATIVSFNEFGEESKATEKEMPKGAFMSTWPDAGNVLVVSNTGSTGGPNGAASSSSHTWISRPLSAEEWEERSYIQFSPGDGEEIQGQAIYGSQVFIFKETKFFVIYGVSAIEETGQPEYHFREVSLGQGTRIKRASSSLLAETSDQICTEAPNGVYFCTTDGVYVTTGGVPSKISQALKPLEETIPFEGPMQEFLNGSNESFRWPATGIVSLGTSLLVKRYEFIFKYDIETQDWTCWKMPSVSATVWTGLTGGGAEATGERLIGTTAEEAGGGTVGWTNLNNLKVKDSTPAWVALTAANHRAKLAKLTNFGFSVPETATIVGIVPYISNFSSTPEAAIRSYTLITQMIKAGALVGTVENFVVNPTNPPRYETFQVTNSEDLWGTTWTPAQINASNFGVSIQPNINESPGAIVEIDWLTLVVFYFTAEASSGVRPRLFCSQSKSVLFTQPGAKEEAGTREAEWQSGFYDLDDQDEKSFVESKLWGEGKVILSGYEDFKESPLFSDEVEMPATSHQARSRNSTKPATLFSHRLKLEPESFVQRLVRYLREKRVPTTDSDR